MTVSVKTIISFGLMAIPIVCQTAAPSDSTPPLKTGAGLLYASGSSGTYFIKSPGWHWSRRHSVLTVSVVTAPPLLSFCIVLSGNNFSFLILYVLNPAAARRLITSGKIIIATSPMHVLASTLRTCVGSYFSPLNGVFTLSISHSKHL